MNIHRNFVRWRINSEAQIRLDGAERDIRALIRDISFKGMCVAIPIKLPDDAFIKMKVSLPSGLLCNVETWVVWHKTLGEAQCYGLYFSRIPDDAKEQMYRFVSRHFPDQVLANRWGGAGTEVFQAAKGDDMEDRRIFQRFTTNFPLSFLDVNHGREGAAQTFDISAKGIGVTSDTHIDPMTPLELWLKIPDHCEPLYTRGHVVWSQPLDSNKCRVGVNLEKADLMGLSRVMRLV